MSYSFELLRELDDNRHEVEEFIKTTSNSINIEEINSKTTFIKQLLGYYNQVIVRVQDIVSKEDLETNITIQREISRKIETLDKEPDIRKKIDTLTIITNNLINSYNNLTTKSLSFIKNDNSFIEYNNLIRKINENIVKINNIELPKSIIDNLLPLYNEIKSSKDISKLNTFLNMLNEVIVNNINTDINAKKGSSNERVFSLFAKINDQIIGSNYKRVNNLIYALYTLEDNSDYYAIIKDRKEIEILDQSFSNLPCLFLTKDNIIDTCKIIIKNASIYYDLNEYIGDYTSNQTKEEQSSVNNQIEEIYITELEKDITKKIEELGYQVITCNVYATLSSENEENYIEEIVLTVEKNEEQENNQEENGTEQSETIEDKLVNEIQKIKPVNTTVGKINKTDKEQDESKQNISNCDIQKIKKFLKEEYGVEETCLKIN